MKQALQVLGNRFAPYRFKFDKMPDISDLNLVICSASPWLGEIEEDLPVEAPSTAKPLCCYWDTVIFYEHPERVVDGDFAVHGECRTALRLDDVLEYLGRQWLITGGSVAWTRARWVMVWRLRRLPPDRELPCLEMVGVS